MTEDKQQNRNYVSSLAKGLGVIQAFGAESPRMTMAEVSAQTGMSRATVRRLLLTLEALGFVQSTKKEFQLTPRVLDLGYSFLSAHNFTGIIQTLIENVTNELGESCSVGMLLRDDVVYVARSPAKHRLMSINLSVGSRLPSATTSMGRVLLAHTDTEDLNYFLDHVEIYPYTDRTIIDKDELRHVLNDVRRSGYCVLDQELEPSLRSLSVPVYTPSGQTVAAVNVSTNAGRVSQQRLLEAFLPVLQHCSDSMAPYITGVRG